ncbi:hypothetical protein CR513_45839, partial [Mucuna pruriens]
MNWIKGCISVGSISALVNNSPNEELPLGTGLRFYLEIIAQFLIYNMWMTLFLLESGSKFKFCKLGSIPFNYLGLPIGANPKSTSTWQPAVDAFRKRFFLFINKYVLGKGRQNQYKM